MRNDGRDRHVTAPLEGDSHGSTLQSLSPGGQAEGREYGFDEREGDDYYISLARDGYYSGKTWFDTSIRVQQERNLRAFNNQHPPGSKYESEQYRKKSRIYRPKTRTAIRKREAAAAIAFFSTPDVVHCSPVNDSDPQQIMAAELHNHLLNYRLDEESNWWYSTVIGAAQDAETQGVVISKQIWDFRTSTRLVREVYGVDMGEQDQYVRETEVISDRPDVILLPIENLRWSPAADWRNVVETSPYLVELVPMYVTDLRTLQQEIDPMTGQPYYRQLDNAVFHAAIHQDWDSIRKAREGSDRLDKYDTDERVSDYQSVWVHKNIFRVDGRDYCYDTLGTEIMLSDPRPIEEVYLHGIRPYVVGTTNIEAHKQYPAGTPELLDGLQEETNDLANLRIDNVKLALNKRYFARRGAGVDVRSLLRNVPGSVTMMENPERDVKQMETKEVTGSSFQEQDRLNMDMDDLTGVFSGGTINANRQLSETVGGMSMLRGDANSIQEFSIRTLAETWAKPVLRHLSLLEAAYETDEVILGVAAQNARIPDLETALAVINLPIKVNVNIGFNSTSPEMRINKLAMAFGFIGKYMPQVMQQADPGETINEVMGAVGHKDASRFFPMLSKDGPSPEVQQLQQQVEQLSQIIAQKQIETEGKIAVAQVGAEGQIAVAKIKAETDLMKANAQGKMDVWINQMKARLDDFNAQLEAAKTDIQRKELYLQREALSHTIQEANRQYALELRGANREDVRGAPEGPFDLAGNDKAGVIGRENYDMIPQNVA